MRVTFYLLFLFSILTACSDQSFEKEMIISDDFFKGSVSLVKMENMKKYKLSIIDSSKQIVDHIYTPYDVFQLETGDINRDGKTDICLGIIKPTPFDPVLKKRLFLFQIDQGYIRPLWLSSRLVNPMEQFSVGKDSLGHSIIHTIENKGSDLYCVRTYQWGTFGMSYINTSHDSITYEKAEQILQAY
ncbi:MAG: nuclear receptor-binding factor 2 [Cytophagaceae bacterium]|jgi:hypothetical protein|nr:nuclear receptor-binding factor 2 [Cytophagaceae bacterium]